ncbi:MAG: lipocalin-like domain-containing protein [Prevotellaceae bacterium]|nr:lipocalin-like domain-containing protein [Prevotellaceae bacterium]
MFINTKQSGCLIGCLCIVLLSITSCLNDEQRLVNKWQLRQYQYSDGSTRREDSVFYNFQKGSFSAVCLLPDNTYRDYYGNYSLQDATLTITLLPEAVTDGHYGRYLGWEHGERTFTIGGLTASSLLLEHAGVRYLFRAY